MATNFNAGEQIVTLSAGDSFSRPKMAVESIILRGTAAGTFIITVGNVTMNIDNSANALTVSIPMNRKLNSIGLTSGPAGATMYVLLEQKK